MDSLQVSSTESKHTGNPEAVEGDVSDTDPRESGIDVISAVLDQVNKLQNELNDVKEQHRTDVEIMRQTHQTDMKSINQKHKADIDTMQQELDYVKGKHEVDVKMIREELNIVKQIRNQ